MAKVHLNSKGLEEWIWQNTMPILEEAANQVAAQVEDAEVGVKTGIGDNGRPYALVTIMEPGGIAKQAKRGTLTRAAANVGLDVTRYPLP